MLQKNARILVVDDMKTMRMVLKKSLRELGYENVTEADDGETAWPLIEASLSGGQVFEAIFSDWNMPKMQGIDLLRLVRGHPQLKAIPFVLVTAETEKSQIVEAAKAGVSNYLMKPFTTQSLGEKITAVFKKRSA